MLLNEEFCSMKYKRKKDVIHFKDAPIIISKLMIADYCKCSRMTIGRNIKFSSTNYWNNFWLLVAYLESKGLRPKE